MRAKTEWQAVFVGRASSWVQVGVATDQGKYFRTGCSAVWLARLTGGQKVEGSNPSFPTIR